MTDIIDIAEADAVTSPVASKNKRPLPAACFACEAPVHGPFCSACGQKNDDCRRSVFRLAFESVGDIFSLDGRAATTLWSVVCRPGRHVRAYGDGKRSPYSPPVRFFLIITLVFFTILGLTDRNIISLTPTFVSAAEGDGQDIQFELDVFAPDKPIDMTEAQRDALREAVFGEATDDTDNTVTINGQTFTASALSERVIVLMENQGLFNRSLNNWLPRLMIVMIPLLALLGAMCIRGRDALIYDHLLVALNTHAMVFIVLGVALLGTTFLPMVPGQVFGWLLGVGVPLYYALTLRGAFGRGWIKTVWSTFIVTVIYAFFLTIGLALVSGRSVLDVL